MHALIKTLAAGAALLAAAPAAAADEPLTAHNPGGIATAMRDAGFKAELDVDDYGDPIIKTAFGDFSGSVLFYGCDDTTHDKCESVQLRAGLDRKTPMTGPLLNAIVKKYRYAAMWLDDEGDPWVNFDIVTGDGIPRPVFMKAVNAYIGNLGEVADMVFEEERGAK